MNYLTIEGATEFLQSLGIQCSEIRMRNMARKKELPFFKDGRRLYITPAALVEHFQNKSKSVETTPKD